MVPSQTSNFYNNDAHPCDDDAAARRAGGDAPAVKVAVITCAVLELEVAFLARQLPNVIHVELMEQGLHNVPAELRVKLQEAVDRVEGIGEVEAIVLGYGLCSRGTEEVSTRRCRLVIPRAHDCVTLLLGSKERYAQYVAEHPGTYWYSPGWIKYSIMPGKKRYDLLRRDYAEKYGEDNADFLMDAEQHWFKEYSSATYVDVGIGDVEQDLQFTQDCAKWLGWRFDRQAGDIALMRDMLAGRWDEERFLVLEPGQAMKMTADERIVEAVQVTVGGKRLET